jgi:hypothetical protein
VLGCAEPRQPGAQAAQERLQAAVAQGAVERSPRREAEPAEGLGRAEEHPGGRRRGHAVRTGDQHAGGGAHAQSEGKLAQSHHRDEQGNRVEQRSLHADRVEQKPVARDLREDGHEHEADEAVARLKRAHHREALPEPAPFRHGKAAQAHTHADGDGQADQRQPPGQAERPDQRERRQRGKDRLDDRDEDSTDIWVKGLRTNLFPSEAAGVYGLGLERVLFEDVPLVVELS